MNPPLRDARHAKALWHGLQIGVADVLGSDHARLIRPDGKRLTFTRLLDSYWASIDPAINDTISLTRGTEGQIVGWLYRTFDDMAYQFDAAGRLSSVTNRAGISHSYSYDIGSIEVTHSLGDSLVYHLDINGKIVGFTDPDGHSYSYSYNGSGLISAITFPAVLGSPQKLYEYDNTDLLARIRHNNTEETYLYASWTYDSERRATSSTHHPNSDTVTFDYTFLNHPDQPQTRTTNALGKETTYHFADLNGKRVTWAVAGHESDNCQAANQVYGYYLNGHLYSKRDWNGITTSYARNAKGQELTRTEAAGTPQQRTITTTWHSELNLPISIAEPGRRTSFTYDGSGNLTHRRIEDTATP